MRQRTLVAVLAFPATLAAQTIFHGNGIPSAYIVNTPAVVDQAITFWLGSPTAPNGVGVLSLASGYGPVNVPGLGLVGLDPFQSFYATVLMFFDANGDSSLTLTVPPGFATASTPPFFANALSVEAGFALSFSKTVRAEWTDANSWEQVPAMAAQRQIHTATALGSGPRDNVTQVLICGGATGSIIVPSPLDSAEIYDPMTRTTQAIAPMSMPRCAHRALRLLDGRVLITGGKTTGGVVTPTCEFFTFATHAFTAAPPMSAPRAGHAMTLLPDGRVLVSGGFADWQNAAVNFVAALNTASATAEVFDPATNAWTPLPNMASSRAGHSQTVLNDGRVLVVSGISGGQFVSGGSTPGQVPVFTASCELFDPSTSTFAPAAPLSIPVPPFNTLTNVGNGFHGASLLPNGDVLITGGFVSATGWSPAAIPTATCVVWRPDVWTAVAPLPVPVALHTHVPSGNGALVSGGYIGDLTLLETTTQTGIHDGVTYTARTPLPPDSGARAAHTCTPLYDGTFLVFGGAVWPATLDSGLVYTR
jgi:hypothetical protein